MAASIQVDDLGKGKFRVSVSDKKSTTTHTVTVDDAYHRKLTGGRIDAAELVRRSFEFLLDRESKESILGTFDLPVIARYFPEYEDEIRNSS